MHDHAQTTPSASMSRRGRLLAALLVPAALLLTGGVAAASGAGAEPTLTEPSIPPADTILFVEGDAANGFGIYRYDGSWEFPPTDSEARAECGEYDRRVQRIRCRVQVRTWYRDLADMKDTITYYRAKLREKR